MADILEFMDNREQWIDQRYELARERMDSMAAEDKTGLFREDYLNGMALFLRDALRVHDLKAARLLDGLSLDEQRGIHDQLYYAAVWEIWGRYLNTGLTAVQTGKKTAEQAAEQAAGQAAGQAAEEEWDLLLWAAGYEWRLAAGYACVGQRYLLTACTELFLQVYQLFLMERAGEISREELRESVRQALYYHFSDYCDVTAALTYRSLLISGPFDRELLSAVSEEAYGLYRLGSFVDSRAIHCCEMLSALSSEELESRAAALAAAAGIMEKASPDGSAAADSASAGDCVIRRAGRVAVLAPAGTERLAQKLCRMLRAQGLEPVCLRRREDFMSRAVSGGPVPELSLFFDRAMKERRLSEEKNAREAYKTELRSLCAVIDLKAVMPGEPQDTVLAASAPRPGVNGSDSIPPCLTEKQKKLYRDFLTEMKNLRTGAGLPAFF